MACNSTSSVCQVRKGFTLIELLLNMVIMALLTSILFPVFGRAREGARRSSCQSNLKQIGLGFSQYAADYDNYLPGSSTGSLSTAVSWPTMIFPYIKSEQVFVCPSAGEKKFVPTNFTTTKEYCGITSTEASTNTTGDGSYQDLGLVNKLSYARNLIPPTNTSIVTTDGWFTGASLGLGSYLPTSSKYGFINPTGATGALNESAIADPAGTIHILDAIANDTDPTVEPSSKGASMRGIRGEAGTDYANLDRTSKAASRHFDGFNTLFGDGHVKWRKYGSTKRAEWSIQEG